MLRNLRGGRRLAVCVLSLMFLTGTAGGGTRSDAADGLNQLRGYLDAIGDLRADFQQQVIGPQQQVIEQASGSVVLSKPGRFRWDYRIPYKRVIVADGKRVWFYEADLEQVTVRRLTVGLGDTPAALLTGNDEALDQFRFVKSWTANDLQWLQLTPVSPEADFTSVELGFENGDLRQIEFVDRLGQRTRVILSMIDHSPVLADNEFEFKIPDGVDVIREDDL